jgi:hypothetical protein
VTPVSLPGDFGAENYAKTLITARKVQGSAPKSEDSPSCETPAQETARWS